MSRTVSTLQCVYQPRFALVSMVRLARAHGIKPVWFWNRVWSNPRGVRWPYVDHVPPDDLLLLLSQGTATPLDHVLDTTLVPLVKLPFIPKATLGLDYCPRCLAEDRQPYFRRRWQMGAFLLCELHGSMLFHRCGHCRQPLAPHLVSLKADSISHCSACGRDLRELETEIEGDFSEIQEWQRRLWKLLQPPPEMLRSEHVSQQIPGSNSASFSLTRARASAVNFRQITTPTSIIVRLAPFSQFTGYTLIAH